MPRRYLGLWTATGRFKILDYIGKKWAHFYVSVTVLMMMKALRRLQFKWSGNFPVANSSSLFVRSELAPETCFGE